MIDATNVLKSGPQLFMASSEQTLHCVPYGRVQQVGSPRELYLHPANAFVASFMGQTNMFSGEIIKELSKEDTITLRLHTATSRHG